MDAGNPLDQEQDRESKLNAALAELSAAIISPVITFDAIYQMVLEKARGITASQHGFVSSLEPQTGAHISNTLTKMRREGCAVPSALYALPTGPHHTYEGLWGHSLNTHEAFFTNHPGVHPAASGLPPGHLPLRNFLAVPVMFGGKILGQIALANSSREYTEADLSVVERLGALYAVVLHNRQQEDKLRSGEERLRFALEGSGDGIWDWNALTNKVFFSKGWKEMLGYREEEIGDTLAEWESRVHPEDLPRVQKELRQYFDGNTPQFVSEHRVRCRDGKYKWILDRGRIVSRTEDGLPLRIVGTHTDIDELRRTQQALRESEDRFRALVMQSYDAVVLIDMETHEIVEGNRRFEEMLGYCPPEDPPLLIDDVVMGSNVQEYFDILRREGSIPHAIRPVLTKAGQVRYMERAGSLIRLGERDYQITTFRDVTEEQKRQQEMQRDLVFAAQVQLALLPALATTAYYDIQTLFRPSSFVSGDLYYLEWLAAEKILRGYLIDVTGHGLATAIQTAAVNVLLHEVAELSLPIAAQLSWLNQRVARYFDESAFAAAIAFEVDFAAGEVRYAAAGITDFLFNDRHMLVPGLFLGVNEQEEFPAQTLPFLPGDVLCFMTDGISDYLTVRDRWSNIHARDICHIFQADILTERLLDDATALCITLLPPG